MPMLSLSLSLAASFAGNGFIYGTPNPGNTLYSQGNMANNQWYINDIGTGQFGSTFEVPDNVVDGDQIRRGNSNILMVDIEGFIFTNAASNILFTNLAGDRIYTN